MERFFKAAPYLVPCLIFFMLNVRIPEEKDYLYWKMVLIFHLPLLLYFAIALMVELIDWRERKNRGLSGKK